MSVLLALLILFILWPLIKFGYRIWKTVHSFKNQFGGMYGGQERSSEAEGQANPHRRKKAIDPNVGEYVEFEEFKEEKKIEVNESVSEEENVEIVTDAEYEDIK